MRCLSYLVRHGVPPTLLIVRRPQWVLLLSCRSTTRKAKARVPILAPSRGSVMARLEADPTLTIAFYRDCTTKLLDRER